MYIYIYVQLTNKFPEFTATDFKIVLFNIYYMLNSKKSYLNSFQMEIPEEYLKSALLGRDKRMIIFN